MDLRFVAAQVYARNHRSRLLTAGWVIEDHLQKFLRNGPLYEHFNNLVLKWFSTHLWIVHDSSNSELPLLFVCILKTLGQALNTKIFTHKEKKILVVSYNGTATHKNTAEKLSIDNGSSLLHARKKDHARRSQH